MTSRRVEFLQACAFSDIDCLDQSVLFPLPPQARTSSSVRKTTIAWPNERHSCDFCDTYAGVMSRCGSCERWLGLSDCECAAPACQRASAWPAGSERFIVVDGGRRCRCRWCANNEPAPASCGRSMGLLRRVVFVLEPTPSRNWRFHVAQRLLVALLENADAGTVLLYSFECADDGDWLRAMERINAFAHSPRAHLPADCRCDEAHGALRMSVLLATHSMLRRRAHEPVRLESGGAGVGHTLAWWLDQAERLLFAGGPQALDELYLLSCNVFPDGGAVNAANQRRLSALADRHDVSVMACDGDSIMMLQIGAIAAELLASVFDIDPPTASPIRRFQPTGPTVRIEPSAPRLALVSVHATQIDELVRYLTRPAPPTTATAAATITTTLEAAAERETLLGGGGEDEAHNRDVLLRLWPFRGAEAAATGSAATYEVLFTVAAAVVGLQTRHSTRGTAMVDWIHAECTPSVARSSVVRNLTFVSARLAHVGVLEREPLCTSAWTLERAIRCGLIEPPTTTFLRDTLNIGVFDAALEALQREWQRMADQRLTTAKRSARVDRAAKRSRS